MRSIESAFLNLLFNTMHRTSFTMPKYFSILIFLTGISILSCKKAPEQTQPSIERISESVYASGVIKSKNQYQVYSSVGGLLQTLLVKEGDVVKKGDPLFIVENEASKLTAENARLAADFAEQNTKGERLRELKTSIETARSAMLNDSIMAVRLRHLYEVGAQAKVNMERQELAYITSKNNYKAVQARYNDLRKQLDFAAAQSKKQLSISNTLAENYVVRSQQAGRVYSLTIEVGEIVSAQKPVAVIGDAESFLAELQIDEYDIVRIKKGQQVLLSLDSYKGQVFEAVVSKIDLIMNERSRSFTVEAEFTKAPPLLYPNLTTEANIVIQTKEKALTIPRSYLINDSLVMMPNEEKRRVQIGLKDYQKAEILSGLSAGETILKPTP